MEISPHDLPPRLGAYGPTPPKFRIFPKSYEHETHSDGEERQKGGGSSRWQIETAKADVECHRWVRDFGADVEGKPEWNSLFATGWCRYRTETHRTLSERPAQGGDTAALINCVTSTCNEAGKRAFGMCGGATGAAEGSFIH